MSDVRVSILGPMEVQSDDGVVLPLGVRHRSARSPDAAPPNR